MIAFVDLETRSRCPLKVHGGRLYAVDPSTELLCGVVVLYPELPSEGPVRVFGWAPWPGPVDPVWRAAAPRAGVEWEDAEWRAPLLMSNDPPEAVLDAIRRGATLVGWNSSGFDEHVWKALGLPVGPRGGELGDGGWLDALDRARRRGLPGKLDAVGELLYGQGKEPGGHKLMMKHSTPQRARAGSPDGAFIDPASAALTAILRYCARDALLLACIWIDERLGDEHPDDLTLEAHERIDRRGVPVDLDLAARLSRWEWTLGREAEERAAAHGVTSTMLHAPQALRLWLRERTGLRLDDLTSRTVEDALRDIAVIASEGPLTPEETIVRDVLTARLAVARVAGGKLLAIAQRSGPGDARLRGTLAYHGAGTGRWSGRGPQPQNFPRAIEGLDPEPILTGELAGLVAEAARRKITPAALLATLLRGVVTAPPGRQLATVDYASIEARVLLWLANDEPGLQVYRDGKDPYIVEAARFFGIAEADVTKTQRQAGKLAVLACGFQGGEGAVERIATKSRIDLTAAGITYAGVVEGWRDAHPAVAGKRTGKTLDREDGGTVVLRKGGFWRGLLKAARAAIDGAPSRVYGITWDRERGRSAKGEVWHLVCRLPSGRPIIYREVAIEETRSKWTGKARPSITYRSPRGFRATLYGGLLAENVTQATARDILAAAIPRLEAEGFEVGLHVHDEIVCEVDDAADLEIITMIAEEPPAWAAGLPIETSGACGPRWGK